MAPAPTLSTGFAMHMLAPASEGADLWLEQVLCKQLPPLCRKVEVGTAEKRGAATAGAGALRDSVHHSCGYLQAQTEISA